MNNNDVNNIEFKVLDGILTVAKIHEMRLQEVMNRLKHRIPLTSEDVATFTMEDYLHWDMFVLRFSKLQDLMGTKLFKVFLEYIGHVVEPYTIIDCLHSLEKLDIIEDINNWQDLRQMRNHLSHDYPDSPELTAQYLNQAYNLAPHLFAVLDNIDRFVLDLRERMRPQ